jgi:DNA-directed RNA polymerase II subunit RPB2
MTIGHLIECMVGKMVCAKGSFEDDATPFSPFNMHHKARQLHSTGYQKYGNETMFNPYSGKMMPHLVFIGPNYYQRLRHLVDDKVYSRERGFVEALTRQPTHGRRRGGGLRFGEMERDAILSHGISNFLQERLFKVSDMFRIYVCSRCGMMAEVNHGNNSFICRYCILVKNRKDFKIYQVYIPYAAKQLVQELMAMHIFPKLYFDKNRTKL